MPRTFRRLVTGNNAEGHSIIVEDGPIAPSGPANNFEMWMTRPGEAAERLPATVPFIPSRGASIFRFFAIPPSNKAITSDQMAKIADGFFAAVGEPAARHDTSRDPLMHLTPTTDYVILLSGSAALLLDTGDPIPLKPFDAVVQRATNHSWLNTGTEDAVFMAVMIGN